MTDAGYILAGYLVTVIAVGGYAAALRTRTRRVQRALRIARRAPEAGR